MSIAARLGEGLEGKYEIEREIGRGGMATVFLARDVRHGREVAVKVLHPELGAKVGPERFQREIRISASLQHPNILPLFDSGEVDGLLYYVMPFVRGESLRDRLKREKQLSIPEAVRIVSRVADALDHAHANRLVHRDIKPENILLWEENVYVTDFGVARAVGTDESGSLTSTGMAVGTPYYMSPEQATADVIDARSDIYALGCVLYEVLAGEPPYSGQSLQAVIARHLQAQIPDVRIVRPTVTGELEALISTAMAKSPADRFQTAGDFARALAEAGPTTLTNPRRTAATSRVPGRRAAFSKRAIATGGGILALVIASIGWFSWTRLNRSVPLDDNLVLIAPFNVIGQDTIWREGLADILTSSLDGAGPLRTVSRSAIGSLLAGRSDLAAVRGVALAQGARLGIIGSISGTAGDTVTIRTTAHDFARDEPLGDLVFRSTAARMHQAADSLTRQLLTLLDRGASSVPVNSLSRELPALKAYLRGEQLARRAIFDSAAHYFLRATELDSGFTLAFQRLAFVRLHQGTAHDDAGRTWEYALRAGRLNRGLGERESLLVVIDSINAAVRISDAYLETGASHLLDRLFAAIDAATLRYPADAEIWFRLGIARSNYQSYGNTTLAGALEAFDAAIARDSAFVPAYIYAIELSARLNGRDDAMRHIAGFLRLNPTGVDADGMRLAQRLLGDRRLTGAEADRLLDQASVEVAFSALQPASHIPDSAETAVRIARRIARDPRGAPELNPDPTWGQFLLALQLGRRGRIGEAWKSQPRIRASDWLGSQLVTLGAIEPRAASAAFDSILTGPMQPLMVTRYPLAFPFWGRQGDTASLSRAMMRADSAYRTAADGSRRRYFSYLRDAATAYRALASADSTEALQRFLALPDSICQLCDEDKLARVRLLRLLGQPQRADSLLARDLVLMQYPLGIYWTLERARVALALNDRQRARREYEAVAAWWMHAEPPLRPILNEARQALRSLAG